jgi:hypothetical protein
LTEAAFQDQHQITVKKVLGAETCLNIGVCSLWLPSMNLVVVPSLCQMAGALQPFLRAATSAKCSYVGEVQQQFSPESTW